MHVVWAALDAANEWGKVDTWNDYQNFAPRRATCLVTVSGTTAAIDIDVDGSFDETNWIATDINNITAKDTHTSHPAAGAADDKGLVRWRYWRAIAIDEGTGNECTVNLWLYE